MQVAVWRMSKGSMRRRENTALVEANWDSIFGKQQSTPSPVLNGEVEGAAQEAVGQGTAVQVLPSSRQDHTSNSV